MGKSKRKIDYLSCEIGGEWDPDVVSNRRVALEQSLPSQHSREWQSIDQTSRFADLIKPHSVKSFCGQIVNRTHWINEAAPNQESRFHSITSLSELERLCKDSLLSETDSFVVTSKGATSLKEHGVPQPKLMAHLRKKGFTLWVRDSTEDYFPGVSALANELRDWTGYQVWSHVFFTPAGSHGFPWHWDPLDTFVFQCEGTKNWKVDGRRVVLPLAHHHCKSWPEFNPKTAQNLGNFKLKSGAFMYLPAGFPHSPTTAKGEESLHVTCASRPVSWHALLSDWVQGALLQLEFDPDLRTGLPVSPKTFSLSPSEQRKAFDHLKRLNILLDQQALQNSYQKLLLARHIRSKSKRAEPLKLKPFAKKFKQIDFESGKQDHLIKRKSDYLEVLFADRKLVFPIKYNQAIEFFMKPRSGSLLRKAQMGLSAKEMDTLIQGLAAHRLITLSKQRKSKTKSVKA